MTHPLITTRNCLMGIFAAFWIKEANFAVQSFSEGSLLSGFLSGFVLGALPIFAIATWRILTANTFVLPFFGPDGVKAVPPDLRTQGGIKVEMSEEDRRALIENMKNTERASS